MDASALTPDATERYRRRVESAAAFLDEQASPVPSVGLVFDPILEPLSGHFSLRQWWEGDDIPHFPAAQDPVNRRVGVGQVGGERALVFEGALSLHEGYTPRDVVFPVRMFATVGVQTVLFVTAARSVRSEISPTDLVLFADHINFQGANPLVGPNVEEWGPRFPDMTEPYSKALRQRAEEAARSRGLPLRQGIYFAALGPQEATRAEYRMARQLGADLVGTSAIPEVIAARHMGLDVLALAVVTRRCLPIDSAADDPVQKSTVVESVGGDVHALLQGTLEGMKSEEKPV